MEIYKLKDEVPVTRKRQGECNDVGGLSEVLKITELKAGVKNPERVNVYVNEKYAFSLDIAQVVELKIKVGRVVTAEELAEFRRASEFGKLYQRALEWTLIRPRSVRETRDYLLRKLKTSSSGRSSRPSLRGSSLGPRRDCGFPSEDVFEFSQKIVGRLLEKGYLDDRRFAEWYVENRFVKKGVSQKRLRMELVKKGIDKEIIDEVLDGRNDEEELRKMVQRKRAKYDDPQKLMAYLSRQGFSYDLVRKVIEEED